MNVSRGMAVLVAIAVLTGCTSRTAEEQEWYDLGYDHAEAMIVQMGLTDPSAICGPLVLTFDVTGSSMEGQNLRDGCHDRIDEG